MRNRRYRCLLTTGGDDVSKGELLEIECRFESAEALQEAAAGDLARGRFFVPGAVSLRERDACGLRLRVKGTSANLLLRAEAVWVRVEEPGAGVGLLLLDFEDEVPRFVARVLASSSSRDGGGAGLHQRVRGYGTAAQLRRSREADAPERVALERIYGKAVWEALLQNPRVTPPEVARIARKGNLPRSALETIASTPAWLRSGEVRRALLANPRLGGASLECVLRGLGRSELQSIARQTAYPLTVRESARKRLTGGLR